MKKVVLFLVAILAVCVVTSTAQDKDERRKFLESKVEEARRTCHEQIVATAKDPSSIQFLAGETIAFGARLTRNDIFVKVPIMGRNTYGAVLRHTMYCTVKCTEKEGCKTPSLSELD